MAELEQERENNKKFLNMELPQAKLDTTEARKFKDDLLASLRPLDLKTKANT